MHLPDQINRKGHGLATSFKSRFCAVPHINCLLLRLLLSVAICVELEFCLHWLYSSLSYSSFAIDLLLTLLRLIFSRAPSIHFLVFVLQLPLSTEWLRDRKNLNQQIYDLRHFKLGKCSCGKSCIEVHLNFCDFSKAFILLCAEHHLPEFNFNFLLEPVTRVEFL